MVAILAGWVPTAAISRVDSAAPQSPGQLLGLRLPLWPCCPYARSHLPAPEALPADITSDTAGFCASQLAADPLSAARFSAAVDIADALTPLGTPLTSPDALKLTLAPGEVGRAQLALRC